MFRRLSRQQHLDFETHALVHLDALMRAAARLCGSREAAEDVVQETYLQAWKYWRTFQPGTNCRAWLFRILFNVIKKRSGEKNADVPLEESDYENILRFEPAGQIDECEVLEVFDHLTEDQRAVLLLVVVEEMSYKEAAVALGVPIGTVMSRLSRARVQLRRMLGRAHPRSIIKAVGAKY